MKYCDTTPDMFGSTESRPLPKLPPEIAFDGQTYDETHDFTRLNTLMGRVYRLMADGKWRTLNQIAAQTGGSEASVSARLRDLRKAKYGAKQVERQRVFEGLFRYRLAPYG